LVNFGNFSKNFLVTLAAASEKIIWESLRRELRDSQMTSVTSVTRLSEISPFGKNETYHFCSFFKNVPWLRGAVDIASASGAEDPGSNPARIEGI
jgi:hypothetical protein